MCDSNMCLQIGALRKSPVTEIAPMILPLIMDGSTMRDQVKALNEGSDAAVCRTLERAFPLMNSTLMSEQVMSETEDGGTFIAFEYAALALDMCLLNLSGALVKVVYLCGAETFRGSEEDVHCFVVGAGRAWCGVWWGGRACVEGCVFARSWRDGGGGGDGGVRCTRVLLYLYLWWVDAHGTGWKVLLHHCIVEEEADDGVWQGRRYGP